ncbi:hypothetical protein MPER_11658 [Moniliophthora perniciosa FA553]|nr:hypothetical protein MPER_11658 [Moniliophthora perniciosa FA553]
MHIEIGRSEYPEHVLEQLMLHTERSCSAPLSVIIQLDTGFHEDELRDIIQALTAPPPHTAPPSLDNRLVIPYGLLKLVLGQASRIRHLALCLGAIGSNPEYFAYSLFPHFQNQFLILEHIIARYPSRFDDTESLLDLFTPSSRIVSFGITNPVLSSSRQYAFHYSRMTNVHIKYTRACGFWTILRLCPNLRTADVALCYGRDDEESALSSSMVELTLQHLESLSIQVTHSDGVDDLPAIINAINLPALSSLSIGMPLAGGRRIYRDIWYMIGVTPFVMSFLRFITRSQSRSTLTIERLELNCFPFQCDELVALMEKLPDLRDLFISESNWWETDPQNGRNQTLACHVLEALASGRILPKMKNLRMVVNNDWVGSDAFERMMESRPRLDSVYLKIIAEAVPTLDISRLRQLQHDRPGQALRIVQEHIHAPSGQIELLGYSKVSV